MTRYNRNIIPLLISGCILLTACDKYLDKTPKGFTLLTTTTDYDQWLNDAEVLGTLPSELNLLTDYEDNISVSVPAFAQGDLIYTWAPQFSTEINTAPAFWGGHYARINKYNTVLQGIDAATGGTDRQRKIIKAEALLGRAFEYFYLLNEYAKQYDSTTAAKDPGVPFITTNDVAQKTPPRSPVKEIYDHILSDIGAALPDLPADNSPNRFRGSTAAAYSVLARIYLYARDYTDAAKNAQLALQNGPAQMLDYNNLPVANAGINTNVSERPDVLYGRQFAVSEYCILDLPHSYDPHDLRFKMYSTDDNFTARGKTRYLPYSGYIYLIYTNFGTSVQEMKLIIAEAAARGGNLTTALQQLNEIRIDRFPAASYQPLQSANQDTVFSWVLRERRFELPFNGLRWFDMRRLDAEGRMPVVNRYDAKGNVIVSLPPHSPKYVLQIPLQVLQFNAGMQQNPQ